MSSIAIGRHPIGPGSPCFIVAEAGVNHNGSVSRAYELIDIAADAGADAVKFQIIHAHAMVSPDAPKAEYQKRDGSPDATQLEMLLRLQLSAADFASLAVYAQRRGIVFLATPFDAAGVDLIHELDITAVKIGSGDVTNHPLLERVAALGKPVILSTGMSSLSEVGEAVGVLEAGGVARYALLQCVSCYPAVSADSNLRTLRTLQERFNAPVGFSDHTVGNTIGIAATALGACILEKHFTQNRNLPGPDHQASADPDQLKAYIEAVRETESALGDGRKEKCPAEANTAAVARRSLFAGQRLRAGSQLSAEGVIALRPGNGIPPSRLTELVGMQVVRSIEQGELLRDDMFAPAA
jgi:N,N'-diacetyllegionaminate synthase